MSDILVPTTIRLPGDEWFAVNLTHSHATKPLSRAVGAAATVPEKQLLIYPGLKPPRDDFEAERSKGGGIAYMPVDPDDLADPALGSTRWWIKHPDPAAIDVMLVPMTGDTEFQVFLHANPGYTEFEQQATYDFSGGAGTQIIANANPHRAYLIAVFSRKTGSTGHFTITFGSTIPLGGLGIRLNDVGAAYEMTDQNMYRGIVRARYSTNIAQCDLTVIEGN